MIVMHGEYELDDDIARLDFARIHPWLTDTYWSPGITRENVEKAARNAGVVTGAYRDGAQVGYARVISDLVRFAYLCDVYVDEKWRGRGIGRAMVSFLLHHPEMAGVKWVLLGTADAHGVYSPLGFKGITETNRVDRMMVWDRPAQDYGQRIENKS